MRVIWKASRAHTQYPKEIDSGGIEFNFRGEVVEAELQTQKEEGEVSRGRGMQEDAEGTTLSSSTGPPRRVTQSNAVTAQKTTQSDAEGGRVPPVCHNFF